MEFLCACFRKKRAYVEIQTEPDEPVQYVGFQDNDANSLKSTLSLSSVYKKMSEWSLPKSRQVNLFTLSEEEHDFLIKRDEGSPPPVVDPDNNFEDVVDQTV